MYKVLLITVLLIEMCINQSYSQVVITHDDMPNVNEIYRLKLNTDIGNSDFDYTLSGQNFIWDIIDIDFTGERQDTFLKVSSTPLIYNIYFSNTQDTARKATIACPRNISLPVPGIDIKDIIFFYKESTDKYSEVGFGATINDIPMPIKYNKPDELYNFPITYGDKDTSYSRFNFNLPDYGYFGESKRRINHVDGWGILATEKGNFPVMRIKSQIDIEDTIFYEAYSQGFKFNRTETEYKWIGTQKGIPLLFVIERMNTINMEVYDTMFMNTASINDFLHTTQLFTVYPNPANDNITISTLIKENTGLEILILDILGNTVMRKYFENIPHGYFVERINIADLGVTSGTYYIKFKLKDSIIVNKIIIF